MPFINLPLSAGVYKDDSPLSVEGFFVDADKVRFVRGRPQTIAGWEIATTDTLTGLCRGLHAWLDNAGDVFAGLGTHLRLHVYFDGALYDITPVIGRGELTNPFDTLDMDATVTVNDTAHGLVAGQKVGFANASAAGGITIDGEYTVTEVLDADSYTIEHSSAATSTVSGGGGTVDFEYFLAPATPMAPAGPATARGRTVSAGMGRVRTWSTSRARGLSQTGART